MSIAELKTEGGEEQISPWEGRTDAENELRWYYCQSGGDLGERSPWPALVFMAQIGGHAGTRLEPYVDGEVTCPGPSRGQLWAAARQAKIREALRKCSHASQALLEEEFSIRKADKQSKGLLSKHDAEHLEPTITYLVRTGQAKLKLDGTDTVELLGLIKLAQELRDAALGEYELARGYGEARSGVRLVKPSRGPVMKKQAGMLGASKRRLVPVEAPRRAKP